MKTHFLRFCFIINHILVRKEINKQVLAHGKNICRTVTKTMQPCMHIRTRVCDVNEPVFFITG